MGNSHRVDFGVTIILAWTLATLAVALRFVARRMTRMRLWLDDYFSLAAYVLACANNGWAMQWLFRDGYGLPNDQITWLPRSVAISNAKRDLYFMEVLNAFSIGCSKLAILGLYWRLFTITAGYVRLPIGFLAVCSMVWGLSRGIIGAIHCIPPRRVWDETVPGKCYFDDRVLIYVWSSAHLLIDILILSLPMFELRKLKLSFWPKMGVIAMFLFGIFVCMCAVAVVSGGLRLDKTDEVSEDLTKIIPWSNMEINFAVVSGCLPLLRVIFKRVFRNVPKPDSIRKWIQSRRRARRQQLRQEQQENMFENSFYRRPTAPEPRQNARSRFIHPLNLSPSLFSIKWSRLSNSLRSTTVSSSTGQRTRSTTATHATMTTGSRHDAVSGCQMGPITAVVDIAPGSVHENDFDGDVGEIIREA